MTEEKCAQILLVFKALLQARISLCNLIVLSCQYECMALAWMESGYLSTCVSVLSVYFLYIYVCTYMQVCSVCIPKVSVSDHWHVCVAGISGQGNSICLNRVLSTPAAPCARTHKHITHPTADTHMSPRQPDTAEDVLLTEKERPPYWQTRAFQRAELLGSLVTIFFLNIFFLESPTISYSSSHQVPEGVFLYSQLHYFYHMGLTLTDFILNAHCQNHHLQSGVK